MGGLFDLWVIYWELEKWVVKLWFVINIMSDIFLLLMLLEWFEWGNLIEDLDVYDYMMSYSFYD